MEKKGELLNQLAIISDLLEKIVVGTKSTTIVIEQSKEEFENSFQLIQKKYPLKMEKPKNTFTISIGSTDIIFNTSNV
jgi:hypothetical protein